MKSIKSLLRILGLFATLTSLGVTSAQAQTPPTRILPLGDSLTSGVSGSVVNGGYRSRLYTLLTNAGYNVDFIGLNTDTNNPTLPDRDHQGVGGIRIDTVQASINDWLDAMAEPDVVLLLLGTNDFSQGFAINSVQTRMNDLISAIAVKRPFAKIIVSNLLVRTDSATLDAQEAVFSAAIPGIVNTQVALGRQVSFLDMRSGILASDLSDGVHPTLAGYNKMADLWFPAITNVISPLGTSNPPVVVNIGPPTTLQQVNVRFSKPLADAAANPSNFALNHGVTVTQATLDAATKRTMTLTTSPQTPGTLYTLGVSSNVRDRTVQQNSIAPGTTTAFAVDLHANGSFELDLASWTSSGNVEIRNASPYVATSGNKLVAFNTGQAPANGVLSQTFPTVIGTSYALAIDVGAFGGASEQRLRVQVAGSGSLVNQTVSVTGPGNNTRWLPQVFGFVANSASTTMTFTDVSPTSQNVDLVLDNVRLTPQVPRTLTVSSVPSSGLAIAVTPPDLNGAAGANTGFSRQYANGSIVTLTAPTSAGTNTFSRWQRNGADFTTNVNATVTLDANYTMNAVYVASNQMLVNGSFETGSLSPWTKSGGTADSVKVNGIIPATDGTRLVEFNSANSPAGGVLTQTFTTVPGTSYGLTFDFGVLAFNTSQQRLQVSVTGNGNLLSQLVTINGINNGTVKWDPKSFSFIANSTSTTLTFTDTSTVTSAIDCLLDNVKVTGPAAPLNASPVGIADNYSVAQNTPLTVPAAGVLSNDTDAETNPLTSILATLPTSGNVVLSPNGGFTYTPNPGFAGTDSFTYRANDGTSDSNSTMVTITVNGIASGSLTNGSFESGESGWVMTGSRIVYPTEAPFIAIDGTNLLILNAANGAPNAVISQTFSTTIGQEYELVFNVGELSFGNTEQRLKVDVAGAASLVSDTVILTGNGQGNSDWKQRSYTFTATSNTTTLTFTDTSSTTVGADLLLDNVRVRIPVPNTAPVAVANSYSTTIGTPLVVPAAGVLTNDTDAEMNTLTAVLGTGPTHGNLTLNPNGGFAYTPNALFSGTDSFTYRANDGFLNSSLATVTITVSSPQALVNGSFESDESGWSMSGNRVVIEASGPYTPSNGLKFLVINGGNTQANAVISQAFPTVIGQSYTLAFQLGILAGNTNEQRLQVEVVGSTPRIPATVESLTGNGLGNTVWTPKSYTFTADSTSTTLTFTDVSATTSLIDLMLDDVSVVPSSGSPTNSAPIAAADSYTTAFNTALTVPVLTGVLANDTDAQLNPLTATVVDAPTSGTLNLAANGGFTYTPATGFSGVVTFTYRANDGTLDSNIATATINVAGSSSQLLVNGSFETAFNGWTVTGNTSVATSPALSPRDGVAVAALNDGNRTPNAVISQSFTTVPGTSYTLEFDAGNYGFSPATQTVQVTVNGTGNLLTQVINIAGGGNGTTRWVAQSFTFVANSTSTTLAFTDQSGTSAALDLLLDNVRVTGAGVPSNTAPVAVADTYATNVDTALVIASPGVLGNDTDAQSNPLTVVVVTPPASGSLNLAANGGFTYTPAPAFTGVVTFTYRANDGSLDSNIATATITVGSSAVQVLINGSFETAFTGWTVTGNSSVATSAALSPTNGVSVAALNDGNRTPNAVISQSFATVPGTSYTLEFDAGNYGYSANNQTVQVTVDGSSNLLTQVITINGGGNGTTRWLAQSFSFVANSTTTTLAFRDQSTTSAALDLLLDNVRVTGAGGAPNTAPVAVADSYSTTLNTPLVIAAPGVLSNDTGAQSSPLTAAVVTTPASGTVNLNSNGGFTYTPATGFIGTTSFTYRASDGIDNSAPATVTITVTPVSSGTFANGSFEAEEANWTMSGNRIIYGSLAPYIAIDGNKMVLFNSGNSAPNAVISQTFTTVPGTEYTLAYQVGIVGGPSNEQRLQMQINGSSALLPTTVETVTGTVSGNATWTPKSYTFTADSTVTTLTFTDISASTLGADLLLDHIRVAPFSAPAAPVALADAYTAVQSTPLVVPANGVLANDTDANLDALTAELVAGPTNGTLVLNPNGGFSYTPTGFFSGTDSFTYRANDGTATSNTVTVTITVTAPQVLVNGSFESGESGWSMTGSRVVIDSSAPYLPSNGNRLLVLNGGGNPSSAVISQTFGTVPGQPYSLSYDVGVLALNTATQTLQLTINGAAALITPITENFTGNGLADSVYLSRSLVFTADSATTTISFSDLSPTTAGIDLLLDNVSVTGTPGGPINASPVAVADTYTTNRNVTLVVPVGGGVLANDTDPEANPLTAVLGIAPSNGTLTLNANGSFSYIPTPGYSGPDSFTYAANDGFSNSNTVTVSITVNASFPGIVNGSFESDFTGWTTTGNTTVSTGTAPPPTQGVQSARFNGANTAPNGVISQSFTSEIGTTYNVAFDAGVWGFNTNAQRLQFTVDGSSNLITQLITINSLSGGQTRWVPQAFSFVANSTTTVLTFTDQSTTTLGLDLVIDNVRVTSGNSGSNTPPVAVAESYGTNVNTPLVVAAAAGVLTNDTDPEFNPLTAILVTSPSSGSLALNPNGGLTYTPAAGFTGNVSFTYRANDGFLDSNIVTVTIAVSPQLVVNGGFESVSGTTLPVFPGWTISGAITTEAGAAYAPTEGTKVIGYNSAQEPNNGVISQTITTVSGQTYTLSLDVGALSFNLNTLPQIMNVQVNGASPLISQTISVNGLGAGVATWVSRSFTFIANSSSTTLRFSDISATTQNTDLLIDNVRVIFGGSSANTAPVAIADSTTGILNTPLVVPVAAGVLANDADAQANPLTAILVSGTANGSLVLNPNGSFTYTPNTGFTGTDSFTYRANDGSLNSNVATVTITTIPAFIGLVNGGFEQLTGNGSIPVFPGWTISGAITTEAGAAYAPTEGTKVIGYNSAQEPNNGVISQSFATVAGQTYNLFLDVGALSFAGNTLPQSMRITATGIGSLLNRTATLTGTGTGTARWSSQAFSFIADSASTTLTFSDISTTTANTDLLIDNVRVTPAASGPNTAPVAVSDSYSATTNTPLVITAPGVLANDIDGESNPLTASLVTAPSNGTFNLGSDGGFTYTPPTGFTGTVSFSYRANDGTENSNVATATISVGQPLVVNGGFESVVGGSLPVFPGWTISGAITTEAGAAYAPTEGTKVIGYNSAQEPNNGVISQVIPTVVGQTYTLALDIGALSFNLNTSPQVMRVGVTGASPLISQNVSINGLGFGTATWVSRSFAFLANSTSTTLTFSDVSLTTQNTDLLIDNVRVSLGGSTLNSPPSANTDEYTAFRDSPLVVPAPGVLLNDADSQGLPLTAELVSGVTHGNLTLNANGSFNYTPSTGFLGTDSFTYRANDGSLNSSAVTVTINVIPGFVGLINGGFEQTTGSGPIPVFPGWTISGAITTEAGPAYVPTEGTKVIGYNSAQTPNNGVISQTIATVTGQTYRLALDVGALSFNNNTLPQVMRITATGNGSLLNRTASVNGVGNGFARFVPVVYSFVADSPATTLSFSDISTTTQNTDLLIDNVRVFPAASPNTAPVATADSYVVNRNTPLSVPGIGVMSNDTDADSNPLVASLVSGPSSGTLSFSPYGRFTYTPANNFTGTVSFTYRLNDGLADSNTATVSILVATPLIANGGFESIFANWNLTGAITIEAGAAYAPTEGTKVIGYNSAQAPNDGIISQSFATVIGQAYTLFVDVGALSFNAITSPQSMGIEVVGATPLINQTATVNGTGTGFANWVTQSYTFVANSTSTTLSFSDRSTITANIDLLIDNVRVFLGASGPNTAPVAVADAYGTNLNTPLTIAAPGVLGNDSDAQSNPLTASLVSGPASGTLTLNPNGGFTYTPATGFTGVASFTYHANDGSLNSNTVTVNISVNTPGVQVLINPSFETGTLAPWITTGGTVDSVKVNGLIPGTNGTKIVEFNSANSPAAGILSQTFATTPGTTYSLEFDLGVIAFNTNQQRLQVSVTGNSTSLLSQIASISGVNNGTIAWSARSYSFVANSNSTTLSFTDISPTTAAIDCLLDNVRVTSFPAPQAVLTSASDEEPQTAAPVVQSSALKTIPSGTPIMSMTAAGRALQMMPSAPGVYQLQRSENCDAWEDVGAPKTVNQPGAIEFVDDTESKNSLPPKTKMFYRIRSVVTPSAAAE
jgi:lysophospholipase L1-like esterase